VKNDPGPEQKSFSTCGALTRSELEQPQFVLPRYVADASGTRRVERERRSVKAVVDSIVADEPGGRWGGWVRGSECQLSREREDQYVTGAAEKMRIRVCVGPMGTRRGKDGQEEVGWGTMGDLSKGCILAFNMLNVETPFHRRIRCPCFSMHCLPGFSDRKPVASGSMGPWR